MSSLLSLCDTLQRSRARASERLRRACRFVLPSDSFALPRTEASNGRPSSMEPSMYHNDEDDSFASSTMAAEGSQPEAMPASSTLQLAFASDEAARAQCLRCKTDSSNYGKHTCSKRRNTSPAVTAVKRTRPKRNSTDPSEAHVDRIWSPASTNVNERLSVSEARMALLSPSAMPNIPAQDSECGAPNAMEHEQMPAQDSECGAPNAMEHEQLEPDSDKIIAELGEALAQPSSVSDGEQIPVGSPMLLASAAAFGPCSLDAHPLGEALAQPSSAGGLGRAQRSRKSQT